MGAGGGVVLVIFIRFLEDIMEKKQPSKFWHLEVTKKHIKHGMAHLRQESKMTQKVYKR